MLAVISEIKTAGWAKPLFLAEKTNGAGIQGVIATDYLYVTGINSSLKNWHR
jgi:hypothetical protein